MEIKTKSIYEPKDKSDGTRILVSRYYPRGVKKSHFDVWVRHASPEIPLLKAYKNGSIDWDELSWKFKEQLRSSEESKAAIDQLIDLVESKGIVTLLCFEREGQNCHRDIVKAFMEIKIKRKTRKTTTNP